jgi:hypothetical protein
MLGLMDGVSVLTELDGCGIVDEDAEGAGPPQPRTSTLQTIATATDRMFR